MVKFNILSLLLLLSTKADALTNLRQVQLTESNRLTLVFDSKVDPRQYNVEFFKDTIQVTFQDASVYPPKISTLNSPFLSKTFAYQYSPSTVRFRMTVKGNAEDYRDHVSLKASGKLLNIDLSKIKTAGPASSGKSVATAAVTDDANSDSKIDEELLAKVKGLGSAQSPSDSTDANSKEKLQKDGVTVSKDSEQAIAAKAKTKQDGPSTTSASDQGASVSLTGNASKTPFPSFKRTLIMLSLVVGVFLMFALVLKKWVKTKEGRKSKQPKHAKTSKPQNLTEMIAGGLGKSLSKNLLKSKSGSGAVSQSDEIELISVKELGPSQSIALVRIGNQELVLGIADGSINVISTRGLSGKHDDPSAFEHGEQDDSDYPDYTNYPKYKEDQEVQGNYSDHDAQADPYHRVEAKRTAPANQTHAPLDSAFGDLLNREVSSPKFSARDRIRSRLEGMKQL